MPDEPVLLLSIPTQPFLKDPLRLLPLSPDYARHEVTTDVQAQRAVGKPAYVWIS